MSRRRPSVCGVYADALEASSYSSEINDVSENRCLDYRDRHNVVRHLFLVRKPTNAFESVFGVQYLDGRYGVVHTETTLFSTHTKVRSYLLVFDTLQEAMMYGMDGDEALVRMATAQMLRGPFWW